VPKSSKKSRTAVHHDPPSSSHHSDETLSDLNDNIKDVTCSAAFESAIQDRKKQQQQHVLTHATEAGLFATPNAVGMYSCFFLKKESQLIMKFASSKMTISRYETLTVFDFPEPIRVNYEALVDDWMESAIPPLPDMSTVNPFRKVMNSPDGCTPRPMFLRLSAMCTYFKQASDGYVRECSKKERPEMGKCFRGRVAMVLKGVKFDRKSSTISPMILIGQVLEFQPPLPNELSEAEMLQRQCVLLDDDEQSKLKLDPTDVEKLEQEFKAAEHPPRHDFFDDIFGYDRDAY